jgi:hypothetical protein
MEDINQIIWNGYEYRYVTKIDKYWTVHSDITNEENIFTWLDYINLNKKAKQGTAWLIDCKKL